MDRNIHPEPHSSVDVEVQLLTSRLGGLTELFLFRQTYNHGPSTEMRGLFNSEPLLAPGCSPPNQCHVSAALHLFPVNVNLQPLLESQETQAGPVVLE